MDREEIRVAFERRLTATETLIRERFTASERRDDEIIRHLQTINGRVGKNEQDLTRLKAISAVIGSLFGLAASYLRDLFAR